MSVCVCECVCWGGKAGGWMNERMNFVSSCKWKSACARAHTHTHSCARSRTHTRTAQWIFQHVLSHDTSSYTFIAVCQYRFFGRWLQYWITAVWRREQARFVLNCNATWLYHLLHTHPPLAFITACAVILLLMCGQLWSHFSFFCQGGLLVWTFGVI